MDTLLFWQVTATTLVVLVFAFYGIKAYLYLRKFYKKR